ncbi:MAG: ATP synthase F1 subunit delta [Phycisphaeraceae bacterium]|nr:ATP synthase F1 subunit delta [Phycisphaeraceae bacterium]MCW5753610.1 ATP synthase F1 subunit delta [Phycisphaeraceae bacterium]
MPLSTAQPDAVAHTYARAFVELAESRGGQTQVEECLGELETIVELARQDAKFSEFLSSRVLPLDKRSTSLERIFSGRVHDVTHRFLQVLNEKGRLAHLPAIVAAIDMLVQERYGRIEVDVYTAAPIDASELRAIRDKLSATLQKDVVVHPYVETSMLGGVKMRIGDQLIDGSLSTRLRKLRDRLTHEGAASVRSRASRILEL